MRLILSHLLHIYVIFMMSLFVLGCIFAASGVFDHWEERYRTKRRQRSLLKSIFNHPGTNIAPWYYPPLDLSSISYRGKNIG